MAGGIGTEGTRGFLRTMCGAKANLWQFIAVAAGLGLMFWQTWVYAGAWHCDYGMSAGEQRGFHARCLFVLLATVFAVFLLKQTKGKYRWQQSSLPKDER